MGARSYFPTHAMLWNDERRPLRSDLLPGRLQAVLPPTASWTPPRRPSHGRDQQQTATCSLPASGTAGPSTPTGFTMEHDAQGQAGVEEPGRFPST